MYRSYLYIAAFVFGVLCLLTLATQARAGNFCSYNNGAPIQDTDIFLLTETGCSSGGTKQALGSDILDYVSGSYGLNYDTTTIAEQAGDYTVTSSVCGGAITFNSSEAQKLIIPASLTERLGCRFEWRQIGTGHIFVSAGAGLTFNDSNLYYYSGGFRNGEAMLYSADDWAIKYGSVAP